MVRTAVTLALLVPLLMPPGVCICHVAVPLAAPIRDEDGDDDCAEAAPACNPCGDSDHDHCPCPGNGQDHHVPNCPVLKFVGNYGLVRPENSASGLMLAHFGLAAAPETTPLCAPPLAPAPGLVSPDAPLFLTLRTLRI
jgi:hypothetical protein